MAVKSECPNPECPTRGGGLVYLEAFQQPETVSRNRIEGVRCRDCGTVMGAYDTAVLFNVVSDAIKSTRGRG
jgi:hypothetical protein